MASVSNPNNFLDCPFNCLFFYWQQSPHEDSTWDSVIEGAFIPQPIPKEMRKFLDAGVTVPTALLRDEVSNDSRTRFPLGEKPRLSCSGDDKIFFVMILYDRP